MEERQSYLDKLIGSEGLKTDIRVSLPVSAYVYIGLALFVGIVASRIVSKTLIDK
jgi:hypothetical protein